MNKRKPHVPVDAGRSGRRKGLLVAAALLLAVAWTAASLAHLLYYGFDTPHHLPGWALLGTYLLPATTVTLALSSALRTGAKRVVLASATAVALILWIITYTMVSRL